MVMPGALWKNLQAQFLLCLAIAVTGTSANAADFRLLVGHGGPVMDARIAEDGTTALTASFDNSVGLWSLDSEEVRWLDGHEAAVKSVIYTSQTTAASSGDDFDIILWDLARGPSDCRTGRPPRPGERACAVARRQAFWHQLHGTARWAYGTSQQPRICRC